MMIAAPAIIASSRTIGKFSASDVKERHYWKEYQSAYEDMIRNTATKHAPWFVVPADNKWFAHMVVADAVAEAMQALDLQYPSVSPDQRAELSKARRELRKR